MNAPTDAKVACASEIWPPSPVKIVIDRKITASTNAYVMRSTQIELTKVTITTRKPTTKTGNAIREVRRSCSSLYSWAIAGGGGSTPASGSVAALPSRSFGQNTSKRNRTRNGNVGWRSSAMLLPPTMSGSARAPIPMISAPTSVIGMFTKRPTAADAIAATIRSW